MSELSRILSTATLLVSLSMGTAIAQTSAGGAAAPSSPAATKPAGEQSQQDKIKVELEAAWAEAGKVAVTDQVVKLSDVAELRVDSGLHFVPEPQGRRLMRALGNTVGRNFLGLVLTEKGNWMAVASRIDEGHVPDEEAKDWKVDELLQSLKDGTESGNADRRARGFPEIRVTGWAERPAYDAATHRLVWAANADSTDFSGQPETSINYNTYLLGREGYLSINVLTSPETFATDKLAGKDLLSRVSFVSGKRYEDFQPSTDKVAAYGIAALIGGVAAKKLGLLAIIGAFAVKFAKVFAVVGIAFGYGALRFVKRLFGRGES